MILTYALIIGCSFMHIFCCGIPLVSTIFAFTATLGFVGGSCIHHPVIDFFKSFELEVLIISGIMLAMSFVLKSKSKNLNCCNKKGESFCKKNYNINTAFLKIACVLYIFNITFYIITNFLIDDFHHHH